MHSALFVALRILWRMHPTTTPLHDRLRTSERCARRDMRMVTGWADTCQAKVRSSQFAIRNPQSAVRTWNETAISHHEPASLGVILEQYDG